MDHAELVKKLKLVKKKKSEIETLLGMPKNSLSGMMNDRKRMPRKWFEALESFVICTDISTGKSNELGQPINPWLKNQEALMTLKLNEGARKLMEEIPGLKPASEIPSPEKPLIFKAPNGEVFDSPRASSILMDEASMWASPKESEDELLGKAVRAAAKKLKQDPYELLACVIENFGKKPEIKSHEKQTAQTGETYFQKRQREKNGIAK